MTVVDRQAAKAALGPRYVELTEDEEKALRKIRKIIQIVREIDGQFPLAYLETFLVACLHQGTGPSDYAKELGSIAPIVSRALIDMGSRHRYRDEGYKLLDRQYSAVSARNQEYFLTPGGKALMRKLAKTMKED
jgi:hypothetical protein